MTLKNLSQKTDIISELKLASSFSDKLLGLLKTSNLGGLMFKTRFGIHTFFLKNPIDVLILDQKFKVIKLKTISPNSLFFWNPKFNIVIELPTGLIKKSKTERGDILIMSTKKPLSF